MKPPSFFKGKIRDGDNEFLGHGCILLFPKLSITFHTIQSGDRRWIPLKHKPIIVEASAWVAHNRHGQWNLYTEDNINTDLVFPHSSPTSSCLRPAQMKGDLGIGIWPMNTPEDYERAKNRIATILGGINLDSMIYMPDRWSFGAELVLPRKLYDPEFKVFDSIGTADFYASDWRITLTNPDEEEDNAEQLFCEQYDF